MRSSTPRSHRRWLIAAVPFGLIALVLALVGLWMPEMDEPGAGHWLRDWLHNLSRRLVPDHWLHDLNRLLYDAAGLLTFEPPESQPTNPYFSFALLFVVLFAFCGVVGVVLELYRPASDAFIRANFWRLRTIGRIDFWPLRLLRKEQAVVIGLGWVGGPLATELRKQGRPVYGTALEEESPTAVKARRSSTLVVVGDSTDPATRARAGLPHASEVFIATGDDARNVEIAGDLLADAGETRPRWLVRRVWNRLRHGEEETRLGFRNDENPLRCYVHIGDPALLTTLRRHGLLTDRAGELEFHLFSNREAAARQLFLDRAEGLALRPASAPRPGEVLHLFGFGFGATGQTVALHAARFAHFAGLGPGEAFRTRLTIFDAFGQAACALERDRFLDRFPAFAPAGLSFDPPEGGRTDAGGEGDGRGRGRGEGSFFDYEEEDTARDGWAARPGRPPHADFRMPRYVRLVRQPNGWDKMKRESEERPPEEERIRHEGRDRWVRPVEYAINAEFLTLTSDVESQAVIDAMAARLSPEGPPVRAAAVVCFEEERESFHAALRLRRALARRFSPSSGKERSDQRPVLPIYVYLPVEEGLVELIARREEASDEDRLFPLHTFGRQVEVNTYDAITRGDVRRSARHIASTHRILSGRRDETHLDFAASNEESALHGPIKLAALGIRFSSHPVSGSGSDGRGHDRVPLLAGLMTDEVLRAHRRLERKEAHRREPDVEEFEAEQAARRKQEREDRKRLVAGDPPSSKRTRYDDRIRFRPAPTRGSGKAGQKSSEPVSPDFVADWPVFGEGALSPELRQRLALLERVYVPPLPPLPEQPPGRDETPEERATRAEIERRRKQIADFDAYVRQQVKDAIDRFSEELRGTGRDADVAAEMEHNRWMGERLSRGWRFGERAEFQRPTMVPWEDLTLEDDLHYDRAHLPRLILEQGPSALPVEQGKPERKPLYAYISVPEREHLPEPDDPAAALSLTAGEIQPRGAPDSLAPEPPPPSAAAETAPPASGAGDTEPRGPP